MISYFMPKLENTLSKTLNVPPYRLLVISILSPFLNKLNTAVIAASPDANANPLFPPSISAINFSRASLVGLPVLEYS